MSKITMQEIKAQYPRPVALPRRRATFLRKVAEGAYCVGGALCYAAHLPLGMWSEHPGFPTQEDIAVALQKLNPGLEPEDATLYARDIIGSNEHRRFAAAWKMVEEALTRAG
jgi:hypothetical protein